ncbi:uncharacterized protein LOC112215645 isoform X2 [Oncorhynchus tshawytscha]|uniref:uncharacterized protein LOC112215645 isoform X2 n=1 Tax=Oncorhynchus tshawytscha TaxID=74940 RepID=UPI000D09C6F3|nr:uncharacterized protein LOC112215645 isoform X2 [Oncorhynchus tshawytscha]
MTGLGPSAWTIMEIVLWVCLSFLCLQGSLPQLTHGADCTGTSQEKNCVSGQTTGGKNEGLVRLKPSAARKTHNQKQPQMWLGDDLLLDRQKRQLGRNSLLPGSFSAKGFPNTLIKVQTERARRHLGQSGTKKNKYKSRVGSFSLLSNNPSASLQVTRVRRQVQNERKRVKPRGRVGAYSIMGRLAPPHTISPLPSESIYLPGTEMQEERTEEKTRLFAEAK